MSDNSTRISEILDFFCPFHLQIDGNGYATHSGPSLKKIFGDQVSAGHHFNQIFKVKKPYNKDINTVIIEANNCYMSLRLSSQPTVSVKASFIRIGETNIIDMSFGVDASKAVSLFDLTGKDFSHTDLTVEFLYLREANRAVMEQLKNANLRLQGDKVSAQKQAHTDPLTGLSNRRALDDVLEKEIAKRKDFALIYMDLDKFKFINDTYGHDVGDGVLKHVSRTLKSTTRDGDVISRIGGDEFIIVLRNTFTKDDLKGTASRILERVSAPFDIDGSNHSVGCSLGIALSRNYPKVSAEKIINDADKALYHSKKSGRGKFSFFEELKNFPHDT